MYRVVFSLWECESCGSQFSAMDGCQECGATASQPDPHVDDRRALVEDLRCPPVHLAESEPIALSVLWGELSEWVARLYEGLGAVGEHGRSAAHGLVVALEALVLMRHRAAATPRLRPFIAVWRTVDTILDQLSEFADANLDALAAPSPAVAGEAHQRAQAILDQAADHAGEAARLALELGTPASAGFFDTYADRTATVFGEEGVTSLTEFDERGAVVFERVTGGASYERGIGLSLVLIDHLARDFLDADRFDADVQRTYELLARNSKHLANLAADEEWMAELRRAKRELFAALVDLHDSSQGSIQDEFFGVRAMLRLGQNLTEGVAPHYLATLLALRGRKDWRRLAAYDSARLVRQTQQAGLASLTKGIDLAVRDADAHRDYDVEPDRVRVGSSRGGKEVNHEELVDIVLADLESCLLLDTALTCALVVGGAPVESLDSATTLIQPTDQMKMLISAAGMGEITVVHRGRSLTVTGRASAMGWSSLPVAAAVEGLAPGAFESLEFVVRAPDGTTWTDHGPLAPLREFRDAEGFDKEAWTVEAMARWRVRSRPLMSRKVIRCWASRRIGQLIGDDLLRVPQLLASLQRLAERLHDSKLTSALGAMERLARARISGVPPPAADAWAADQLARWINDCGDSTQLAAATA